MTAAIAVVVVTHDSAGHVADTLGALVPQLRDGDELIVVDNGSRDATAAAVRLLAERARVIAEGAGGLAVAAALSGEIPGDKLVCIVSGGNIDAARLSAILGGATPL